MKSKKNITKNLLGLASFIFPAILISQNTMDKIIAYDKLNFGNGYNSVTHEEFYDVIYYENIENSTELLSNAKGNNGILDITWAYTKDDLKKIMNLSTSVDLDIKFKGFSSSNKYKSNIYKETKFSKVSETAVISASYANEPIILLNPKMKKKLVRLAKKDSIAFMIKYGDCFVSKIYTGGELYAILNFESSNALQKKKNTKYFESVNKYAGNKLSYKTTTSTETIEETDVNKKYIKIFTSGGGDLKDVDDIKGFIDYASKFKSEVRTDAFPSVLYVELSPYESLPGFPKLNFSPIRETQKRFIDNAIGLFNQIEEFKNLANFVIENKDMYEESDFNNARDYLISSTEKLITITQLLETAKFDFTKCDERLFTQLKNLEKDIFFEAVMDYPFFNGKPQDLPLDINGDFQTLYDDTFNASNQLRLQIFGELDSKDKYKPDQRPISKPVVFSNSQEYRERKKKTEGDWRGVSRWYLDIYEIYSNPYYLIRFTDVKTNQIADEIKWDGTPLEVRPNTRISFKLVNPDSYLMSLYKGKWSSYSSSSFIKGPKFTNIAVPNGNNANAPKVVITDTSIKPTKIVESKSIDENGKTIITTKTIEVDYRKPVLKDGYYIYE